MFQKCQRVIRKQKWLSPIDWTESKLLQQSCSFSRDVKNALINLCNFVPFLKHWTKITCWPSLLLFHLIISLAIRTFILTFSQLHEVLYTNMIILWYCIGLKLHRVSEKVPHFNKPISLERCGTNHCDRPDWSISWDRPMGCLQITARSDSRSKGNKLFCFIVLFNGTYKEYSWMHACSLVLSTYMCVFW
jgi:hypothetical protein